MNRGGFSIIEIVVTITILGILLTLGVVSMNATQVNARDAERKADVESIAMIFEDFYKSPVTGSDNNDTFRHLSGFTYPDATTIDSSSYFDEVFSDMDRKIVRAPGVSESSAKSLKPYNVNGPTVSEYMYEPLARDGTECYDFIITGPCVKFNLYYRLEKNNSIQMMTSKNQ